MEAWSAYRDKIGTVRNVEVLTRRGRVRIGGADASLELRAGADVADLVLGELGVPPHHRDWLYRYGWLYYSRHETGEWGVTAQ